MSGTVPLEGQTGVVVTISKKKAKVRSSITGMSHSTPWKVFQGAGSKGAIAKKMMIQTEEQLTRSLTYQYFWKEHENLTI